MPFGLDLDSGRSDEFSPLPTAKTRLSSHHLETETLDHGDVAGGVRGLERCAVASRLQPLRAELAGELLAVRPGRRVLAEAPDASEARLPPLLALVDREQHARLLGDRVDERGAR